MDLRRRYVYSHLISSIFIETAINIMYFMNVIFILGQSLQTSCRYLHYFIQFLYFNCYGITKWDRKLSPPSPRGIILSQMSHVLQFDAILLHSAIIVMHKIENNIIFQNIAKVVQIFSSKLSDYSLMSNNFENWYRFNYPYLLAMTLLCNFPVKMLVHFFTWENDLETGKENII